MSSRKRRRVRHPPPPPLLRRILLRRALRSAIRLGRGRPEVKHRDPITLDDIESDDAVCFTTSGESVLHWFSAEGIKAYWIFTGNFLNPRTRQPASMRQIRAVDRVCGGVEAYTRYQRLTAAFDVLRTIGTCEISATNEVTEEFRLDVIATVNIALVRLRRSHEWQTRDRARTLVLLTQCVVTLIKCRILEEQHVACIVHSMFLTLQTMLVLQKMCIVEIICVCMEMVVTSCGGHVVNSNDDDSIA